MTLDLFAPKKHAPTLHHGDCLAVLKTLDDASVDAVVTDPPYLIDFMGKGWDSADGIAGKPEVWAECLRVLKPGGHLLAFGATRTYHRMTCAIEDAGFEIRDSIHWMYSTGFPKSLNVAIALDKESGAMSHRGKRASFAGNRTQGEDVEKAKSMPPHKCITDLAKQWSGFGTALKPAHEPVVVARKPLAGTVAANVERYGTGALNIDASRVQYANAVDMDRARVPQPTLRPNGIDSGHALGTTAGRNGETFDPSKGRWPPNIVLSHSPSCTDSACDETCAVAELDRQSDSSSRFFPVFRYQAKASRSERGETNVHPTVKPIALMEWLVTLVTPPGGVVLDPFMGSGTTGVAAVRKGFRFVGIEREDEYLAIARARIEAA